MTVDKFRLLFFGSDQFSVRILKHLLDRKICPTQVITKTHTLLDKFSVSRQLIRHGWQEGLNHVPKDSYNIGVVASFGHMIDATTVNQFKYGLFNVHPSLLPQYRGSTPIQAAIFDGCQETGCTIMRIPPIPRFDIGEIVLQRELAIGESEYAIDLRDRLADIGAEMLENLLLNYESCIANVRPQGDKKRSLARKLKPEMGHLKFKSESLDLLDRKVRAYTGFIELYMTCLGGLSVRLEGMVSPSEVETYDIESLARDLTNCDRDNLKESSPMNQPPGSMYFHKIRRLLCIKTVDGRWSAFKWATPERKPRMNAADFYNGYLSKVSKESRLVDH